MQLISNVSNIVDIIDNTLKLVESEEYQKLTAGNPVISEFKSVFIRLPRRSGHTSAAFELLSIYPSSHLIYPKSSMTTHARQQIERLHTTDVDGARTPDGISLNLASHIHTLNHNLAHELNMLQHIDLIIFDCYSTMSRAETESKLMDTILYTMNPKTKLFVFLQ